jgi:hypothetical protein
MDIHVIVRLHVADRMARVVKYPCSLRVTLLRRGINPAALRKTQAGRPNADGAYLSIGDLIGKLDVLRIECSKCERSGR